MAPMKQRNPLSLLSLEIRTLDFLQTKLSGVYLITTSLIFLNIKCNFVYFVLKKNVIGW